jgi:hypothetical protein
MLWRMSKVPEAAHHEALEMAGSSGSGRRFWRSEVLKEVEGSGGSKHEALEVVEGYGGGQRLWRRSKAPEAAQQEALETAGSSTGGRNFWKRLELSKDLEEVEGSGGG